MPILAVLVILAKNLRCVEGAVGKGYYVSIKCTNTSINFKKNTKVIRKGNNPVWKEGVLHLKFQIVEELQLASPAGIVVKQDIRKDSGYFIINLFNAEDLPRMDFGNIFECEKQGRQLVDCYFVASFLDHKVTSTIIKQCSNPMWNQRLYLQFSLPLQSDSIKFELKDEDIFTGDDLIATSILTISEMTANHQEGCMPCFGPSYLNFYGSQRQFSILENDKIKEINSGLIEGCAYRGRVFLEIKAELGNIPDDAEEKIPDDCIENSKEKYTEKVKKYTPEKGQKLIRKFASDFNSKCISILEFQEISEDSTELDKQLFKLRQSILQEISSKMAEIKSSSIKTEEFLGILSEIHDKLQNLHTTLSQNEFPDIFIWLCHNWKKVAYCRIPAADILYSDLPDAKGQICDRTTSLTFKYSPDVLAADQADPGVIRATIWLGPEERMSNCFKADEVAGSSYVMFAETYENKVGCCGKWTKTFAVIKWSDFLGRKYFKTSNFPSMDGWTFEGEWFTEHSSKKKSNKSVTKPKEDDRAIANSSLKFGEEHTDLVTDSTKSKKSRVADGSEEKQKPRTPPDRLNVTNKHANCLSTKRILWRRKLVPTSEALLPARPVLKVRAKKQNFHFSNPSLYLHFEETQSYELKIYLYQARNLVAGDRSGFSDPFVRIHFLSSVKDSRCIAESLCPIWNQTLVLSNVAIYGKAALLHNKLPEVIAEIYDHDRKGEAEYLGKAVFSPILGPIKDRSSDLLSWRPIVLNGNVAGDLLVGAEISLIHQDHDVDSTVQEVADPENVPSCEILDLPQEIKPVLVTTTLEILCIGLRNWDSERHDLTRPFVEFLYDSQTPIGTTNEIEEFPKNLNFSRKFLTRKMELPKDDSFLPSLTVRLKNRGAFGRIAVVGACVIGDMMRFVEPDVAFGSLNKKVKESLETVIDLHSLQLPSEDLMKRNAKSANKDSKEAQDLDWWSKYYASKGEENKSGVFFSNGYQPIQIYQCELENKEPLKSALKVIQTFPIIAGKAVDGKNQSLVADLKASFRIRHTESGSKSKTRLQVCNLVELEKRISNVYPNILLRVYLIRAYDLKAKDWNRESDPFIKIEVGDVRKKLGESLRRNCLNPIFGCIFESMITIPKDNRLVIKIVDKDVLSDDLIGETHIDLEDRLLAPCWATCGLSPQYLTTGPFSWRDSKPPTKILEEMCALRGIPKPVYNGSTRTKVGKFIFDLVDIGAASERLALHVLHRLDICVPEHVETRTLFLPSKPGFSQGKLEMWIDMFPMNENDLLPEPVSIIPRVPKSCVLRCVVYNAYNVPLDDRNLAGDEMSDVYVKAWLKGQEDEWQKTDVHYRCIDGEANFNWRMIFPFLYLSGENKLVHKKKKRFFDMHVTEVAIPPTLCLQIYDYDVFSRDDPLGTLELELTALVPPIKKEKKLKLAKRKKKTNVPRINLFKQRLIRGFWLFPWAAKVDTKGKLELELQLLSEEEAELKPAGLGRDEPNANPHLDVPIRPSTSFFWLASPLKFLKFLVCKRFRTFFILLLLAILAIVLLYFTLEIFLDKKNDGMF